MRYVGSNSLNEGFKSGKVGKIERNSVISSKKLELSKSSSLLIHLCMTNWLRTQEIGDQCEFYSFCPFSFVHLTTSYG